MTITVKTFFITVFLVFVLSWPMLFGGGRFSICSIRVVRLFIWRIMSSKRPVMKVRCSSKSLARSALATQSSKSVGKLAPFPADMVRRQQRTTQKYYSYQLTTIRCVEKVAYKISSGLPPSCKCSYQSQQAVNPL